MSDGGVDSVVSDRSEEDGEGQTRTLEKDETRKDELSTEFPDQDQEVLLLQRQILPEGVLPRELLLEVLDVEEEGFAVELVLSFESRVAVEEENGKDGSVL